MKYSWKYHQKFLDGFFLVGLPWENQTHLNETEKHIFEINSDFIELHIAVPYYCTELYEIAKKDYQELIKIYRNEAQELKQKVLNRILKL